MSEMKDSKEQLEIQRLKLENEKSILENKAKEKKAISPFFTGVLTTILTVILSGSVSYFVAERQIDHEKEISDRQVIQQILNGNKPIYEQKLLLEFYRDSDSLLTNPEIIDTRNLYKLTALKAEKEILEGQDFIHKALII